jgi:hypothetical protein
MNKKLLIAQVIISLIAIYFIITSDISLKRDMVADGYVFPLSLSINDTLSVFLNGKKNITNYPFRITDTNGNEVGEFIADLNLNSIKTDNPWKNGFGYPNTSNWVIPKMKSGIYFIEDKVPFLIKPNQNPEIIVVYPFSTINAYSNVGGKGIFPFEKLPTENADTVSFLRPFSNGLNFYLKDFMIWMNNTFPEAGYVADFDLEDDQIFRGVKLIIIPGHQSTWSEPARENLKNAIALGANAIILSGNTLSWSGKYTKNKTQLICFRECSMDPDEKTKACRLKDLERDPRHYIFSNYYNGGHVTEINSNFGIKILSNSSPIFQNLPSKIEKIKIKNSLLDGLEFIQDEKDGSPIITDTNFLNSYRKEFLGYAKPDSFPEKIGTFVAVQKFEYSGTVINVGNVQWCSVNGIGGPDSIVIRQITKNMIHLLLSKESIFSDSLTQ